ncbi:hypothetical protein IW262DRAFT_1401627 [Armillaria fumosa]|nr:hypothetical protein IW262DRAFT_1401627 [Armillaria fumosa]
MILSLRRLLRCFSCSPVSATLRSSLCPKSASMTGTMDHIPVPSHRRVPSTPKLSVSGAALECLFSPQSAISIAILCVLSVVAFKHDKYPRPGRVPVGTGAYYTSIRLCYLKDGAERMARAGSYPYQSPWELYSTTRDVLIFTSVIQNLIPPVRCAPPNL